MNTRLSFDTNPVLWAQAVALTMAGCAVLLFNEREVYLGGLFIFTGIGLAGLVQCILRSSQITPWDLLLTALCLAYGLGTLNTELTWLRVPADYLRLTTAHPKHVMKAAGILMLLGATLCVASSLDRNCMFDKLRINPDHLPLIMIFVTTIAAASIAQIAIGTIGFHQNMTGEGVRVSPLAALTVAAIVPAAALTSFVWRRFDGWQRYLMLSVLIVLMLVQFYQGRRVFIYSLVVCLMCYFAANPPKRLFTLKNLLTFALSAALIMFASKAFFAMRMAVWELGSTRDTAAMLSKGFDVLINAQDTGLDEEVAENQKSRTFIIGYLAELVGALELQEPLYGDVLVFDIAINVPSVLWPEKYKIIALGVEEVVANPHFGLSPEDDANSIATAGAADFGIPGIFIYSLLQAGIYSVILRNTRRLGAAGHLIIAASLADSLLNIEGGVSQYLSTLRSLSIALIATYFLRLACVWYSSTPSKSGSILSLAGMKRAIDRLRLS